MFCLQVEGPIVGARGGGGGVSGGSRPSDKRGGGAGHPVPEKKGGQFQKKFFSAPVWSKNRGEGARAPPLDPSLGECYNRQFTVIN